MTPPAGDRVPDARERILRLLEAADLGPIVPLLHEFHPSDIADVLESVEDEGQRMDLLRSLPTELASEALAEMEGDERSELLAALAPESAARFLHELEDDDAADLIGELDPQDRAEVLAALPFEQAGELRGLLLHDEETAGGIMTTSLVSVGASLTAAEAIQEVRRQGREVEDFYTIFVVDSGGRLQGTVPLDELIMAEEQEPIRGLVEPVVVTVAPDVDQEEVGRLMSRYNVVSMPVVDPRNVLLGRITFDDVIDVLEAEQTEDILRLAGVSDEEELRAEWHDAVRMRLPWLLLNLITASLAASVVFIFSDVIDSLWFLAAIMPVIAGLGGNSGTQALAVTVRRFAVEGGPLERKSEALRKEVLVAIVNGLGTGLVAGGITWILALALGQNPLLAAVVLGALWGNIVVSGFVGAFIPTVLDRVGLDPAVASSVFITTFTDLFGFLLLLGLATAVLL